MSEQDKWAEGFWPADDLRRAFVAGAKWWEFESWGTTMRQGDQGKAKEEAERRYPGGKLVAASPLSPGRREG